MVVPELALRRRTCYEPVDSTHPDTQGPADQLISGISVMDDNGISVKQCDERLSFVDVAKKFPKHSTFLERNWVKVGFMIGFFGVIVPVAIALIHDAIV